MVSKLGILVVVLLLVPVVSAISINAPADNYFSIKDQTNLHFYTVHNNGSVAYPSEFVYCTFSLFNVSNNNLLANYNLTKNLDNFQSRPLNSSNFANQGAYPYTVRCLANSSDSAFLSGLMKINVDGINRESENALGIIILGLLPLAMALILIVAAMIVSELLRIFFIVLSSLLFTVSAGIELTVISYYNIFPAMQEALSRLIMVLGFIFAILLVYFLVCLIQAIVAAIWDQKKKEMEY